MKILMYAPIFPPAIGGPATQSHSLCQALMQKGVAVAVVTPGDRFGISSPDGYRVYRYRWKFTGLFFDKCIRWIVVPPYLLWVISRERPDIIHCHSVSGLSLWLGVAARVLGIPTIIKFAGDWVWETLSTSKVKGKEYHDLYTSSLSARFLTWVERFGLSQFTVIWVVSEYRRGNIQELLGTDKQVRRIPNSLLLPLGGYEEKQPDDIPIVISANRFIPHKRLPMLVRAFARMQIPQARLVLIGGGDEREAELVRDEIRAQGVEDRVELTGILPSSEIYDRFKTATLYVSSSLEEGLPNVFIEAMHFGLPVVSTDVGGSREIIADNVAGLLVDPMDEQALSSTMKRVIEDVALRNRLAKGAFEHAKQYDLSIVVESFISMYRSLLKT
ncbi:MAG TPA: glycosyltransferase family 4 protein [Candidatus Paceibacterota bacterium]|nr:glycosyltransferase family 4 protein [Candidatus Paceibacterota bacterium]